MPIRLRDLPFAARLALTLLLLVNLGGFVASAFHLRAHHENRDEQPGISMTDLEGAYHGVTNRAPLLRAVEAGHPGELEGSESLDDQSKQTLLSWLAGSRVREDYDSLDLGDNAPVEILAARCTSCHSRKADDPVGKTMPLEFFDDVMKVAVSREIAPTDTKILLASTHTHAISLATISLLVVAMMLCTAWPRVLSATLALLAALGLTVDLASWWLARSEAFFVEVLVLAGAVYGASMVAMMLAIIVDLWLPRRSG